MQFAHQGIGVTLQLWITAFLAPMLIYMNCPAVTSLRAVATAIQANLADSRHHAQLIQHFDHFKPAATASRSQPNRRYVNVDMEPMTATNAFKIEIAEDKVPSHPELSYGIWCRLCLSGTLRWPQIGTSWTSMRDVQHVLNLVYSSKAITVDS